VIFCYYFLQHYLYCNVFRYSTRLISSLCQECSNYLLSLASTITLCNYTTSTIFSGGHPKTVLRMQSPSDISVAVATQLTFCYNRGYFLGNGLRPFHRSVSSRFQHVTISLKFPFICLISLFSFRAIFCFTNPDDLPPIIPD
jgi:hypothetical protein